MRDYECESGLFRDVVRRTNVARLGGFIYLRAKAMLSFQGATGHIPPWFLGTPSCERSYR